MTIHKEAPFRMVSALGIGVALGTIAWLALNLVGIAGQVASVAKYFPGVPASPVAGFDVEPATSSGNTKTGDSPGAGRVTEAAMPSEPRPERDDPALPDSREFEDQPDYVADFDLPAASIREPAPDSGRLVMDPRMFVFEESDAELDTAFDELLFHPDDDIRQAAIENLLPAIGR